MSSYSDPPIPEALIPSAINGTNTEHKIKFNQAVLFTIPIFLSFTILIVYFIMYLRRRSSNVDWTSFYVGRFNPTNNLSMIERGLHKDLREIFPIVIFGESFAVKDSQCSVCLGDYQTGEKLQQIPACAHTFHMECIDIWLTSHSTCPLCRVFLIPKVSQDWSHQTSDTVPSMENSGEGASAEPESQSTTEAIIHIDDGQEGDGDIREV
ncbi:RING-H2 finger protein ATL7 [Cardamine amara subsp. amara]|uniref:RING-type E3 ubiquitin transferase n=1 Tax=Cardamine amara subsp. amara TaxID=228776 RepID=A0ABD1ATW9_CARAN